MKDEKANTSLRNEALAFLNLFSIRVLKSNPSGNLNVLRGSLKMTMTCLGVAPRYVIKPSTQSNNTHLYIVHNMIIITFLNSLRNCDHKRVTFGKHYWNPLL